MVQGWGICRHFSVYYTQHATICIDESRPDGDFGVYEMPTAFDDRGYPTSLSDVFCRGADGKKAEVLDSLRSWLIHTAVCKSKRISTSILYEKTTTCQSTAQGIAAGWCVRICTKGGRNARHRKNKQRRRNEFLFFPSCSSSSSRIAEEDSAKI